MEEPLKTQPLHHGSSLKNKTTPGPGTPNKSVNFKISPVCEKEREKFLTAKYGAHQMSLIRKRLKVQFLLISIYIMLNFATRLKCGCMITFRNYFLQR